MILLKAENIKAAYGRLCVLENISFSLEESTFLCVVGENGSGKSTLIKCVLGLHIPESGKIEYYPNQPDKATGHMSLGYGESIGYLAQQSEIKGDFPAVVEEVVISGCFNTLKGGFLYNKKAKLRGEEMMEKVGISHLAKTSFHELSGGQRQRVLLARALCATDKLLVLDEPTRGLDAIAVGEMHGILKKLKEEGITIMMISHDLKIVQNVVTHVLHINKGMLFYGKIEDYVKTPYYTHITGGCLIV